MALEAGDAGCTTGLARRLFDARAATVTAPAGEPPAMAAARTAALKADCYAIATAFVAEIAANARVTITVSGGGLQSVGGVATDAPAAPVDLAGSVS